MNMKKNIVECLYLWYKRYAFLLLFALVYYVIFISTWLLTHSSRFFGFHIYRCVCVRLCLLPISFWLLQFTILNLLVTYSMRTIHSFVHFHPLLYADSNNFFTITYTLYNRYLLVFCNFFFSLLYACRFDSFAPKLV